MVCPSIPDVQTWAAYEARNGADVEGDHASAPSALGAQRSFMKVFGLCGRDNPEKKVTRKGFCEHIVKGIVEDDLPYSLGEKMGMKQLFEYVLPYGYAVPRHQTVRHDLDILYEKLDERINKQLKVRASSVHHTELTFIFK
jgi:hypothetical protein